jgi:tRNA pseudouridine38-40 synthase
MPRFKLTIEYLGTRYSGWQIQSNARTVAGTLAAAVREATAREKFELYGSGRTDAGVHALQQVAHLDVATTLAPAVLVQRLNEVLPHDVVVVDAAVVGHRFHARRDAARRSYLYQIATRPLAFGKPIVWWVKAPLDVDAMREAATAFQGFHDFRAFTDASPGETSTMVLVEQVAVTAPPPFVLIRVVGSHFLWKMVRRLVGVLVEVGRGGLTPEAARSLLGIDTPVPARLTAPAAGLFLERVFYPGDDEPRPFEPVLRL